MHRLDKCIIFSCLPSHPEMEEFPCDEHRSSPRECCDDGCPFGGEKKNRGAVDIHGPAQRSATPYRSGMHYLCFRRSRKPAETGRSIYLRDVSVDDARAAHSLALSLSFMSLSLSRFRIALPQAVGPARVIQGISAETDVGVDRRVSFSHPSRGPTICHSGATPDPFPPPNVFGERRQPMRSRLINHAIN